MTYDLKELERLYEAYTLQSQYGLGSHSWEMSLRNLQAAFGRAPVIEAILRDLKRLAALERALQELQDDTELWVTADIWKRAAEIEKE